ncbi:LysR family transcriptional regulator [Neokomagataea thailandica NBRC 106555]|nr:LysR family transcriptional regulator [Neokomagataea thailandica NBRC 106555]
MIKQLERATAEISAGSGPLVGRVSAGMSPYSAGSTLSLALLRRIRSHLPLITLHLTESFDDIYSEMIMTGRLDMAVIHGAGPIKGVSFTPLMREEFFLLAPIDMDLPLDENGAVHLASIVHLPLLLPPTHNFVRKRIDMAFQRKQITPTTIAEIEGIHTMQDAVAEGLGATILPWSVASRIAVEGRSRIVPLRNPTIQEDVSLCVPESIPETEASVAVKEHLMDLARAMASSRSWPGTHPV